MHILFYVQKTGEFGTRWITGSGTTRVSLHLGYMRVFWSPLQLRHFDQNLQTAIGVGQGALTPGLWPVVVAATARVVHANLSLVFFFPSLSCRWLAPSRWNRLTARVVEVVVFFSSSFIHVLFLSASSRLILSILSLWSHLFLCSHCKIFPANVQIWFLFLILFVLLFVLLPFHMLMVSSWIITVFLIDKKKVAEYIF